MLIRSFKLKLIFSCVSVVLVSLGCVAFFVDRRLEDTSLRNIQLSLVTEARLIERRIASAGLAKADLPSLESLIKDLAHMTRCRITVIAPGGTVLADSEQRAADIPQMESHLNRPEVRTALAGGTGIDTRYSSTLKIDMLYVAIPVRDTGGAARYPRHRRYP